MKRQRGIADGWLLLIALAGIGVGLWWAYDTVDQRGYQRGRLEVQAKFDAFKAKVKEDGLAAEAAAKAKAAKDKANKEKADATKDRELAAMRAANQRLRNDRDRARGSILPPAAPGAKRPDRAPIDRAEYERAYRELVEGLRAVGDEGDETRVKLDTAKQWAQP